MLVQTEEELEVGGGAMCGWGCGGGESEGFLAEFEAQSGMGEGVFGGGGGMGELPLALAGLEEQSGTGGGREVGLAEGVEESGVGSW